MTWTKQPGRAKTLPVVLECWNCDNPAPESPMGAYRFVAIEPNEDWHPICEECSGKPMEVAAGEVERYALDGMEFADGRWKNQYREIV